MKDYQFRKFILFWASQSVSGLGSAMSSYALIIWAYEQTKSALGVSLPTFFYYIPYVLVSLFSGNVVDTFKKKNIILTTDTIAFLCTLLISFFLIKGKMEINFLYITNFITGFMNAFQSPAVSVAVGLMVPKDKYSKISGMNSFSESMQTVLAPTFATLALSLWGLKGVLLIDLISFLFAFIILLKWIQIPEKVLKKVKVKRGSFISCQEGLLYLKEKKALMYLILSMALFNFLSRLTYENILPAMILARSNGNEKVLGCVSGILGIGGILSSLYVSVRKLPGNNVKLIYFSAAISFLFGDIFMGLGNNVWIWGFAALAASLPIPFISAGQNVILYHIIPSDKQGRVFAVRNAIQFSTIPIGILLGGFLADYVFEPFLLSHNKFSAFFQIFVGSNKGSGMGAMFLITGVIGFLISIAGYKNKRIISLSEEI